MFQINWWSMGKIILQLFCKRKNIFFLNQKSQHILLVFWMFQISRWWIEKIIFQFFWKWKKMNQKTNKCCYFLNVSDHHTHILPAAQRSQIRFLWPRSEARCNFNCRAANPDRNFRRKNLRKIFTREKFRRPKAAEKNWLF